MNKLCNDVGKEESQVIHTAMGESLIGYVQLKRIRPRRVRDKNLESN